MKIAVKAMLISQLTGHMDPPHPDGKVSQPRRADELDQAADDGSQDNGPQDRHHGVPQNGGVHRTPAG